MNEAPGTTPPGSLLAALRERAEESLAVRDRLNEADVLVSDSMDVSASVVLELIAAVERYEVALREIGTPKSVPEHFDPLDWWRHTASKRGEIARDALGVTVEELIRDGE